MFRRILIPTCALLLTACATEPDCEPDRAFEQARLDRDPEPACQARAYADAWQLGQTLGAMERERDALIERAGQLDTSERMRLRVLERDIPQLEALARIEGHLAPVEIEH